MTKIQEMLFSILMIAEINAVLWMYWDSYKSSLD